MVEKIRRFFVDARTEFRHVNWPVRADAIRLTAVVVGLSIGLAVFLGAFDYLFAYILQRMILRG